MNISSGVEKAFPWLQFDENKQEMFCTICKEFPTLVVFTIEGGTDGEKMSIFYFHFKPCTIMFSTFFLAYSTFFHLKKCFYSDFWPSALRLRMEESAVILAAFDVCYGVGTSCMGNYYVPNTL